MDRHYTRYYSDQAGGSYSYDDFGPLLRTQRVYQKGRGLGGFFGGIFRYLKPLLTSALQGLKSEALQVGSDILQTQKPINEILRDRSIQLVDKLRDKAAQKIKQMSGTGAKKSIKDRFTSPCKQLKVTRGRVKKRKKKLKNISNKKRIIDIFS